MSGTLRSSRDVAYRTAPPFRQETRDYRPSSVRDYQRDEAQLRGTRERRPPRHLHHDLDELWYVLAGDYVVEIGSERHLLKPGDCILGPRRIPHAWAFVGDSPGRLLIAFTPAGKMQENFERDRKAGEYRNDAEVFRAYGMKLVGPPLSIGEIKK